MCARHVHLPVHPHARAHAHKGEAGWGARSRDATGQQHRVVTHASLHGPAASRWQERCGTGSPNRSSAPPEGTRAGVKGQANTARKRRTRPTHRQHTVSTHSRPTARSHAHPRAAHTPKQTSEISRGREGGREGSRTVTHAGHGHDGAGSLRLQEDGRRDAEDGVRGVFGHEAAVGGRQVFHFGKAVVSPQCPRELRRHRYSRQRQRPVSNDPCARRAGLTGQGARRACLRREEHARRAVSCKVNSEEHARGKC